MYTKLFSGKILFLLCVGILITVYVVSVYAGNGGAYAYPMAFSNYATADNTVWLNVTSSEETGDTFYGSSSFAVAYVNPPEVVCPTKWKYKSRYVDEYNQGYQHDFVFDYYFTPEREYAVLTGVQGSYTKISPYAWDDTDSDYWP